MGQQTTEPHPHPSPLRLLSTTSGWGSAGRPLHRWWRLARRQTTRVPKSVRHNRLEQKYCNQNVCGRNQDVPETCPNLAVTTTSLAAVKQDLAERGPNLIEPGLANRAQVWLGQSAQVVRGETDSTILFCSDRRLDFMALDARPLCTPRRVIQRAETSTRGAPTLTPSRPRGRRGRAHIAGEVAPLWHCTGVALRAARRGPVPNRSPNQRRACHARPPSIHVLGRSP